MTEDKKCLNCSRMTVSQDEYISGMQDKIHDLEKQIEKLKCCQNCSHFFAGACRKGIVGCYCCNKWELADS